MRSKIESVAKKEDTSAVVFKFTEAPGIGFEGLYFGVKTLGEGIGNAVLKIGQ